MELPTNRTQLIALGTAGALLLVAGGYWLGQAGSSPSTEAAAGEEHEGEVGGENKLGSEASEHSAGLGERGAV